MKKEGKKRRHERFKEKENAQETIRARRVSTKNTRLFVIE